MPGVPATAEYEVVMLLIEVPAPCVATVVTSPDGKGEETDPLTPEVPVQSDAPP
jgi:hypothetical protein